MARFGINVSFLFLLFSLIPCHAAKNWLYEDVLIDDVSVYSMGSYTVMQVKLKNFPTNTNCAPANEHGLVYMNASQQFGANWQLQYSTFLSAQAQGLPVDVLVDDAICNTDASTSYDFGGARGLGLKFYGVRLDGADQ